MLSICSENIFSENAIILKYASRNKVRFRKEREILQQITYVIIKDKILLCEILHWCSKLKGQPSLLFSSFVHSYSINEHKNIKLREDICYKLIN